MYTNSQNELSWELNLLNCDELRLDVNIFLKETVYWSEIYIHKKN